MPPGTTTPSVSVIRSLCSRSGRVERERGRRSAYPVLPRACNLPKKQPAAINRHRTVMESNHVVLPGNSEYADCY
jgi:hypothetical protein